MTQRTDTKPSKPVETSTNRYLEASSVVSFVLLLSCFSGIQPAVSQVTCSEPCTLPSEISQTSDPMSLQKPPASFWGVTGGCGFGTVTAAGARCWVDATHK